MKPLFFVLLASASLCSCHPESKPVTRPVFVAPASIPPDLIKRIEADKAEFTRDLDTLLAADTENFLVLIDKTHPLPEGFEPADLVPLAANRSYAAGRTGLSLRRTAEAALERMAAAARKDGVTLVASSSYRSYNYQKTVYERNVRELGQEAADRESARPGTSQHQLGLAVDFGSITDDFAYTAAGKWLSLHAADYGWSLSFPEGYEGVTGYRYECWHYRYIGPFAAAFQQRWFGGIQQYMIEYIDARKRFDSGY